MAQAEMQLAACSAFLQILRNDLVPLGSYTQTFLQTILMAIDSRDLGKEYIICEWQLLLFTDHTLITLYLEVL